MHRKRLTIDHLAFTAVWVRPDRRGAQKTRAGCALTNELCLVAIRDSRIAGPQSHPLPTRQNRHTTPDALILPLRLVAIRESRIASVAVRTRSAWRSDIRTYM